MRHWGSFAGYAALGVGGFALGLMSLVYYAEWMKKRSNRRATTLVGPGAAATDEFRQRGWIEGLTPGMQLALLIAVGIGVHNFGEGLAIGQAATAGQVSLAVTLIVGFSLHNATEGFGICGPMSGEGTRPSWGFLALLGAIGGAPTFFGTVLGQAWSSEAMTVVFFAVAAGSILYVVQELFAVNRKHGHADARDVARARGARARLRYRLRRLGLQGSEDGQVGADEGRVCVEARFAEPAELLCDAARHVVDAVDLDHGVLGTLGHDDVAEHEGVRHPRRLVRRARAWRSASR